MLTGDRGPQSCGQNPVEACQNERGGGESWASAKLVRESRKSEEKDWAGRLPLGESSTIIPIIEERQRLGGRLETR